MKIDSVNSFNTNKVPQSCTIFTVAIGENVFFGNNEDYNLEGTYIWLIPSQEVPSGLERMHGAVFFGFDHNDDPADGYIEGGMNDQGLCFDANGLPVIAMNPHPEREHLHPQIYLFCQILFECSTVNETIDFYKSHNFGNSMAYQIHFADAIGDAVVISGGSDGEFAYTRIDESNILVSTNFNLVNPSNGWYPCQRYTTASSMLEDITSEEELTVDACRDVLSEVQSWNTAYSNIFDPIHRDYYIYHNKDFDNVAKLNLNEELENVVPGASGVSYCYFISGRIYPSGYEDGIIVKVISIADLFNSSSSIPYNGFLTILIINLSVIGIALKLKKSFDK